MKEKKPSWIWWGIAFLTGNLSLMYLDPGSGSAVFQCLICVPPVLVVGAIIYYFNKKRTKE